MGPVFLPAVAVEAVEAPVLIVTAGAMAAREAAAAEEEEGPINLLEVVAMYRLVVLDLS